MPNLTMPQSIDTTQLSDLARHYYAFMQRQFPASDESVLLAGALVVQAGQEGHTCLDLRKMGAGRAGEEDTPGSLALPEASDWETALINSEAIGRPGSFKPFILDEGRLYLQRYWQYEESLAAELRQRAAGLAPGVDLDRLSQILNLLFPVPEAETEDWQRTAAAVAALKRLCIISGGPGTGKTHTVARIIVLLQMLAAPNSLNIVLAAPTGKAASRLAEAIEEAGPGLTAQTGPLMELPTTAYTVHRLLKVIPHSPYFRHNSDNKLNLDVLIVDEVSMIDLALMAKLLAAVPKGGRVILLGDKDQLASVEAGRVMADLCGGSRTNHFSQAFVESLNQAGAIASPTARTDSEAQGINDCLVSLTKSYRFAKAGGIAELAAAIMAGRPEQAARCFEIATEVKMCAAVRPGLINGNAERLLARRICQGYRPLFAGNDPALAFAAFENFQVLCVHRDDLVGDRRMNGWIAEVLGNEGLIASKGEWYQGRPVIVTGNHYGLGLFNGDIGITLSDAQGRLRVYFRQGNKFRAISCARMPAHETAFVITVHKSQGSEFSEVILLLPDRESPILNRELLYTAVTRARQFFELWGAYEIFAQGVQKRAERGTGLAMKLRRQT